MMLNDLDDHIDAIGLGDWRDPSIFSPREANLFQQTPGGYTSSGSLNLVYGY